MNTYGDNGNVLMLKYVAEKLGARVEVDIVSLEDDFDKDSYDIVFFGGGQDYEQTIVARDLPAKKEALESFINVTRGAAAPVRACSSRALLAPAARMARRSGSVSG